jgi:hypothetical protein
MGISDEVVSSDSFCQVFTRPMVDNIIHSAIIRLDGDVAEWLDTT